MSLSPSPLQWPGPMFSTYELPSSDSLTAGIIGSPTTLSGIDPVGYSRDVFNSWLSGSDATKLGTVEPAGQFIGPSGPSVFTPEYWRRAGVSALAGLLALALVILGLWYLLKGGE